MANYKDEYTVGFTIHEARDLVSPDGQTMDPLVIVNCLGKSYTSKVKYDRRDHVTWDESMLWSDISLYEEQF